jgi:hypothetical protein
MNSSGSIHISENASIWLAVNRSMPSQPRCGRATESRSAPAGWKTTSGSHDSSRIGRNPFASPSRYLFGPIPLGANADAKRRAARRPDRSAKTR